MKGTICPCSQGYPSVCQGDTSVPVVWKYLCFGVHRTAWRWPCGGHCGSAACCRSGSLGERQQVVPRKSVGACTKSFILQTETPHPLNEKCASSPFYPISLIFNVLFKVLRVNETTQHLSLRELLILQHDVLKGHRHSGICLWVWRHEGGRPHPTPLTTGWPS